MKKARMAANINTHSFHLPVSDAGRTRGNFDPALTPVPKMPFLLGFIVFPAHACSTLRLDPPGSARLLANHDGVEEVRGLHQSLFRREQTVFMLDGEHRIVTKHAQSGDELSPPFGSVTVAAGAEDPAAFALVVVGFGIEHAGTRKVGRVKLGVFGVGVENCALEYADGANRIDTLPEEMARIEVATYAGSCDGAQPEHRLRAIDYEPRVHFDGDLHAMVSGELRVLGPIGRDDLVPLPVEDLAVVGRPGAGDPVGSSGVRRIAGASGEVDYHRDTQHLGEQDGLAAHLPVLLRAGSIGMQRVAVTT